MTTRFDERSRDVLLVAQGYARMWRHPFLGTEHLLAALLDLGGDAVQTLVECGAEATMVRQRMFEMIGGGLDEEALATLGIDLRAVREVAESRFGVGALDDPVVARTGWRHTPFTRRLKVLLSVAVRAAGRYGDRHIRPEHLWLALVEDRNGVAMRALRLAGLNVGQFRGALTRTLSDRAA